MMPEMLLKAAGLSFMAASLLALLAVAGDRLLPVLWARERHDFALGALVAVPLVFLIAMLPAEPAIDARIVVEAVRADLPKASGVSDRFAPAALALWIAGTMLLLVRLMLDWVAIVRLRTRSIPLLPPAGMSLSRRVPLRQSHEVTSPLVIGYWRPVIILPVGFALDQRSWPVLEHEIAHVRRGDNWVVLALRIVRAMLWWNLPMRVLERILVRTREELCDDRAAAITQAPLELSHALLDAAAIRASQDWRLATGTTGGVLAARLRRLTSIRSGKEGCRAIRIAIIGPLLAVTAACTTPHVGPQSAVRTADEGAPAGSALALAVARGDAAAVARLLAEGADPDVRDTRGDPALAVALRDQRLAIAQQLLVAGADVDARDTVGDTVLASAVRRGDEGGVALLVVAGANPHLADTAGETVVSLARRGPGTSIDAMLPAAARTPDPVRVARWVPPRTPAEPTCPVLRNECYSFADTDGPVPH